MKTSMTAKLLVACVFLSSALVSTQLFSSQGKGKGGGGAGGELVGSKGCGLCHKPEKKLWDEHKHSAVKCECETCHGPGHKHAAAGPKKLRSLKKKKKNTFITVNKKMEACGECHKVNDDDTISLVSDFIIEGNQQYTEMLYNKKKKFKMNCVMCHDPHASVTSKEGIKRKCLDCHKGKFKVEVKIEAMSGLSCEDCHMPYAVKNESVEKIGDYVKGDARSHIFGISVDPDYKLNDGSGKAKLNDEGFARLTVEQTCYACHKTGKAPDMSREALLEKAKTIH